MFSHKVLTAKNCTEPNPVKIFWEPIRKDYFIACLGQEKKKKEKKRKKRKERINIFTFSCDMYTIMFLMMPVYIFFW
jgi:hypothetical protein